MSSYFVHIFNAAIFRIKFFFWCFFFVSFSFDAFIMRFIFYAGHMVKCANEMLTKRGHSFATCLILSRFQFLLDAFHWMSLLVSAISSFYRLFFFFFFFFLHSFHLQKPKLAKSNSVINNVRCYLNWNAQLKWIAYMFASG